MSGDVLATMVVLTGLGVLAAVVLYVVSRRFEVREDERVIAVEEVLPGTNCGGCGQPGCHAFAAGVVKADTLDDWHCPVGGNDVMNQVAEILGVAAVARDPYIAVVRCSGSFEYRKKTSVYDGATSCQVAAQFFSGDTACAYGCLGLGDCVAVCDFDAMYMDPETGLPVVIEDKCTACNVCVKTCPKDILELWPKGKKNQRIYVACLNEDKSGTARKACAVACTGCAKCSDACRYDAITIDSNLAVIDHDKCKLCMECVDVCDVRNILTSNVPEEKITAATQQRIKREERKKQKELEQKRQEEEAKKIKTPDTDGKTE